MTNLGQIRLFSNLTTIFFNGVGFGLMTWVLGWNIAFFNWFQGPNLLGDNQNFKNGLVSQKGRESSIKEEPCFLYQSKLLSHFVPVSPDTLH